LGCREKDRFLRHPRRFAVIFVATLHLYPLMRNFETKTIKLRTLNVGARHCLEPFHRLFGRRVTRASDSISELLAHLGMSGVMSGVGPGQPVVGTRDSSNLEVKMRP